MEFPSHDFSGPRLVPLPDLVQSRDEILQEIEVITSSSLTYQVANSLLNKRFADQLTATRKSEPDIDAIAELFSKNLRVSHEPSDRLALTIRYSHANPEVALKVVNSVAQNYIDYNRQIRFEEYMREVETLRGLADSQRKKVKAARAKIDQLKKQNEKRPFSDDMEIRERLNELIADRRTFEARMSDLKDSRTAEYMDAEKTHSELESEIAELEALLVGKHQSLVELNTLKRDLDIQNSALRVYEEHLSSYRAIVGPFNPRYPRVRISREVSVE
ncbi:MAG TPA: hypothetical protein VJ952_13225 [Opitutales bacterium]|nr:hypothetical protein [Opitutales bacterium]